MFKLCPVNFLLISILASPFLSCSGNLSPSTVLADGIMSGAQVTLPFKDYAIDNIQKCNQAPYTDCKWTFPAVWEQWWRVSTISPSIVKVHGVVTDRMGINLDDGIYVTPGVSRVVALFGQYKVLKPLDLRIYDDQKVSMNISTSFSFVPNGGVTAMSLGLGCEIECRSWGHDDDCLDVIRPGFIKMENKSLTSSAGSWRHETISLMVDDLDLRQCGKDLVVYSSMQAGEVQSFPVKIQILTNH